MTNEEYVEERIEKGFKRLGLPPYMKDGVVLWVTRGIRPGGFLMAVMENSLVDAFLRADDNNTSAMRDWANFVYNDLPAGCHGSTQKVREWASMGGLKEKAAIPGEENDGQKTNQPSE